VTQTPLTTTCTKCKSSHYLKDGACVQSCPAELFWTNQITRVCTDCPATCKTCLDSSRCQTCKDGFHLNTQFMCEKCVVANCKTCTLVGSVSKCTACNPGFYKNSAGQCVKCMNGCDLCQAGDSCDQCETGWLGVTAQTSSGPKTTCSQCTIAHCDKCDTADTCKTCADKHFLVFNQAANKKICTACDSSCTACDILPNHCTQCKPVGEILHEK
jgi:hypothetical protein